MKRQGVEDSMEKNRGRARLSSSCKSARLLEGLGFTGTTTDVAGVAKSLVVSQPLSGGRQNTQDPFSPVHVLTKSRTLVSVHPSG